MNTNTIKLKKINNNDRIAHYVNVHDNQDYYVYYTETEAKKLSHGEVEDLLENFEIIFMYPIYEHLSFNFNTRKLVDFGETIGTISYYRPIKTKIEAMTWNYQEPTRRLF